MATVKLELIPVKNKNTKLKTHYTFSLTADQSNKIYMRCMVYMTQVQIWLLPCEKIGNSRPVTEVTVNDMCCTMPDFVSGFMMPFEITHLITLIPEAPNNVAIEWSPNNTVKYEVKVYLVDRTQYPGGTFIDHMKENFRNKIKKGELEGPPAISTMCAQLTIKNEPKDGGYAEHETSTPISITSSNADEAKEKEGETESSDVRPCEGSVADGMSSEHNYFSVEGNKGKSTVKECL